MISQVHITPRGPLVKGTSANFPKLAELAPFIPLGLAVEAAGKLERVEICGRAA